MGLKLLASICTRDKSKKKKSGLYSHGFFLLEASLPALDESEDTLSTKLSFPGETWSVPYQHRCFTGSLQPTHSTIKVVWRCTRGRHDSIPNWFLVPYHQDFCLICPFPLILPGVEYSTFPGMFLKLELLGEASILRVPVHIPRYSPDHSRISESSPHQ